MQKDKGTKPKPRDYNGPLREAFRFDDADLKANHEGTMSQQQKRRLGWHCLFPPKWWLQWSMTIFTFFGVPLFVLLLIEPGIGFETRILAAIFLGTMLHSFVNRFAIGHWRKRSRDMREGVVECLYGRVLHLPQQHLLIGAKKLGPVSHKQQQAFEHDAYYRVYIAPHSGDILAAEPAGKPKYD